MSHLPLLSLAAAAVLWATPANAQGRHVFVIDASQSSFTFSGSVTLPPFPAQPIVGQPSNTFALAGTLDTDLTTNAGAVTSAQMVPGGGATTVPELMGFVPNPIPFLPPIATIKVTGLVLIFESVDPTGAPASFPVAANGSFSAAALGRITAGVASVTALGSTTAIPLTGQQSPSQPITGSITSTPAGYALNTSVQAQFSFMDPTTGAFGSMTFSGAANAAYRPLNSDVGSISLASGGTQNLILSTGGVHGGKPYLVLGSASGTAPGFALGGGLVLPLNPDAFLVTTATNLNMGPFVNTFGVLSGVGKGQASIALPPGLPPALAGTTLDFAYLVIDAAGNAVYVSNPNSLLLVQ